VKLAKELGGLHPVAEITQFFVAFDPAVAVTSTLKSAIEVLVAKFVEHVVPALTYSSIKIPAISLSFEKTPIP
jgi:hypothetical protein